MDFMKGSFVLSGNYSKGSNVTVNNGVLTVNKKNLTITVNDTDFIYGVGGKVEIVADAPINGTVSVKFNGETFEVELVDGKGSFTVDGDITPGEYPVSVEFAGNDEYAPAAVNSSLTVSYGNIDLDISVSVDKETVNKGDNVTVTVIVKNNGDKVITYLNGKLGDSYKLISVDASKGTFDSDSGLWYIGPLNNGESVYLILTLEAINVGINDVELVIFVNGTDFNKSSSVSIEVQDNKTDSNGTDVDTEDSNQSDKEIISNDESYNGSILNSNNNYSSLEKTGNPILVLLLVLLALPFVRRFKK